ncbi:MAG: inositol monophosphatase [Victivallales bacterium]|nr:inositol monophosphatase [Victivallales bacterium]
MDKIREFISSVAFEAGEQAKAMRAQLTAGDVSCKDTAADIVTAADKATEELIFRRVSQAYPEHRFFGEETGKTESTSPYCWIVDPIDGTVAYLHGAHTWTVSIALYKDNQGVAAAVYAPMLNELYVAVAGQGATLNGEPIHVAPCSAIENTMATTGFACLRAGWKKVNNLYYFGEVASRCRSIFRLGSAALDLCYVASGRCHVCWELNLNPYDVCGGALLVQEAGGKVTDLQNGSDWPHQGILATNGELHDTMLKFFEGYQRPEE